MLEQSNENFMFRDMYKQRIVDIIAEKAVDRERNIAQKVGELFPECELMVLVMGEHKDSTET